MLFHSFWLPRTRNRPYAAICSCNRKTGPKRWRKKTQTRKRERERCTINSILIGLRLQLYVFVYQLVWICAQNGLYRRTRIVFDLIWFIENNRHSGRRWRMRSLAKINSAQHISIAYSLWYNILGSKSKYGVYISRMNEPKKPLKNKNKNFE